MATSRQPNSENLLESIIGLTEQRTQQSLENCLIETMRDLTGAVRVALYGLSSDANNRVLVLSQFSHAAGQPRYFESQAGIPPEIVLRDAAEAFRKCLENQEVVDVPQPDFGGVRILYPVLGAEEHLTGLLAVDYLALSPSNHRLISAFLRIYQNYQNLLSENQRDRLTGLLNRRTFEDQINQILAEQRAALEAGETGSCYFLTIFDIDFFKKINDTYGHLYGDEVLLLFARLMRQTFRGEDLLYRFGGEEFVVLLKATDTGSCLKILERFRQNVENFAFPQVGRVTVSGGCVAITGKGLQTTLLDHADQALYYAKNHGRNQILHYEQLVEAGKLAVTDQEGSVDLF